MTILFTRPLCTAILAVTLLTACSRPVAYFQRVSTKPSTTPGEQPVTLEKPVQRVAESGQSGTSAQTTIEAPDTYARQDSRLPATNFSGKRIARIGTMLASPSMRSSAETSTAHKLTGIERLVLRRVNNQIRRQLAPSQPEKALIRKGKLIGSIVLLIAGLLMLILGTGTVAFIGLIVGLVGAVGLIVSLIGIDS